MGTTYWACDDAGKRWADLGKAYDLSDAVSAAGLDAHQPVLTADFLTAYLAATPDDPCIEALLRWQREVCGGRPLSLWNEHADDRPWMDWDSPDFYVRRHRLDWTKDDPMTPKWWTDREPVTAKEGKG